jgi:ribbon-helix-helix CopG family protein
MKTLRVQLSDSLAEQVEISARRRGMSKSEVIREALAVHLAGIGSSPRSSFTTLAGDLVGRVEGPEDLATNKDHLVDYGR